MLYFCCAESFSRCKCRTISGRTNQPRLASSTTLLKHCNTMSSTATSNCHAINLENEASKHAITYTCNSQPGIFTSLTKPMSHDTKREGFELPPQYFQNHPAHWGSSSGPSPHIDKKQNVKNNMTT